MKVVKLHRNADPKNQPAGTSRLIINYNINYEFGSNAVEDGFDFIEKYADKVYVITAIKGDEEVARDESNLPDDLEITDYDVDEPNKFGIRYIML